MGDVAGSVRELERVRAESPRFVPGRIHLGLGYYAAGRRDDAAGEWRAVLGAEPDNRSARMYLAMLESGVDSSGSKSPGGPSSG